MPKCLHQGPSSDCSQTLALGPYSIWQSSPTVKPRPMWMRQIPDQPTQGHKIKQKDNSLTIPPAVPSKVVPRLGSRNLLSHQPPITWALFGSFISSFNPHTSVEAFMLAGCVLDRDTVGQGRQKPLPSRTRCSAWTGRWEKPKDKEICQVLLNTVETQSQEERKEAI